MDIALIDIASMYPSNMVSKELFRPEYSARLNAIIQKRIAIKCKEFDKEKKKIELTNT